MNQKQESLTRKELYDLVWSIPMTKLSKKYHLSDNGLRKICKKHNIPLPKAWHWAKVHHKVRVQKTPLPKRKTNIDVVINIDLSDKNYSKIKLLKNRQKEIESDPDLNLDVPKRLSLRHPLVQSTKNILEDKKQTFCRHPGIIQSRIGLSIRVSKKNIPRALRFFQGFIGLISQRGYKVKISNGQTYVELMGEELVVSVREKLKKVPSNERWREFEYKPSGELIFSLGWIYPERKWKDGKRPLEGQLSSILAKLETKAEELHEWHRFNREAQMKREEEERKALEEQRRREEDIERFEQLRADARNWHEANQIREYLNHLKDNQDKLKFDDFLKWALCKADQLDPTSNTTAPNNLGSIKGQHFVS